MQVRLHILLQLDGLAEWMPAMAEQVSTQGGCSASHTNFVLLCSGHFKRRLVLPVIVLRVASCVGRRRSLGVWQGLPSLCISVR